MRRAEAQRPENARMAQEWLANVYAGGEPTPISLNEAAAIAWELVRRKEAGGSISQWICGVLAEAIVSY